MQKVTLAKKFKSFAKGASLASTEANSLEGYETENDERHWSRHIQKVVMGLIALYLAIQIIYTNVTKVGQEKS